MKSKILIPLLWVLSANLHVSGQEKLYPVRPITGVSVFLTADRTAVAVEKAFQHKVTLGHADDDETSFLPDTRTPIIVLSMRVQNVSQRPLAVNISQFTSTDDEGRTYPGLNPDEAFARIMAGAGGSIGSKTLRGISLGRVGGQPKEDQVKEDMQRYSLKSGEIPPGSVREGLIYFEAPSRNKFTVSISLGDLWSRPLLFSTTKQK